LAQIRAVREQHKNTFTGNGVDPTIARWEGHAHTHKRISLSQGTPKERAHARRAATSIVRDFVEGRRKIGENKLRVNEDVVLRELRQGKLSVKEAINKLAIIEFDELYWDVYDANLGY
jgi:hypothetical protein